MRYLIAALVAPLLLMTADCVGGHTEPDTGEVVGMYYEGSRVGVGVGPTTGSNGGGTTVLVTSSGPSRTLILRLTNGDIVETNVSLDMFASVEEGDRVPVTRWVGLSGMIWSTSVRSHHNPSN